MTPVSHFLQSRVVKPLPRAAFGLTTCSHQQVLERHLVPLWDALGGSAVENAKVKACARVTWGSHSPSLFADELGESSVSAANRAQVEIEMVSDNFAG